MNDRDFKEFYIENYNILIKQYKTSLNDGFKTLLKLEMLKYLNDSDENVFKIFQQTLNNSDVKYKYQYFNKTIDSLKFSENECFNSNNISVGFYSFQDLELKTTSEIHDSLTLDYILETGRKAEVVDLLKGFPVEVENTGRIILFFSNYNEKIKIKNVLNLDINKDFITYKWNNGVLAISKNIHTKGDILIKIENDGE